MSSAVIDRQRADVLANRPRLSDQRAAFGLITTLEDLGSTACAVGR